MAMELLAPHRAADPPSLARYFDIKRIYFELAALNDVGERILQRFPDAQQIEIESHQQALQDASNPYEPGQWTAIKREVLVLGVKKSLLVYGNGRSADFIAPSLANGCTGACTYCYVARNKGYGNPVTLFTNVAQIFKRMRSHCERRGPKSEPNQTDPEFLTYDVGCNSDFSADCHLNPALPELIDAVPGVPHMKLTFATKFVNHSLLQLDPRRRTRIRFSLMPEETARRVDVRTDSIKKRLAAVNSFVAAGYEVHLNFSPVIVKEGWLADWEHLFLQINDALDEESKRQAACEVIFLTHNAALHEINMGWNPRGEELLWQPELQQRKRSLHTGQWNLRYKTGFKRRCIEQWRALQERMIPWCTVRYCF